jgi:hypothetical protein
MYPTDMQVKAITSLIDIDVCGGKLLIVVKTGPTLFQELLARE